MRTKLERTAKDAVSMRSSEMEWAANMGLWSVQVRKIADGLGRALRSCGRPQASVFSFIIPECFADVLMSDAKEWNFFIVSIYTIRAIEYLGMGWH